MIARDRSRVRRTRMGRFGRRREIAVVTDYDAERAHRATSEPEAHMRSLVSCAAALTITALTAAPVAAQRADSALVGSWSGQAPLTVSWTVQRSLTVRLDIKEDGSVTGTIGDAQLLDARIYAESQVARAIRLARQYAIAGRLNGCLIRAEGVLRERVHLSLDVSGQTLTGDLQTSGSYEGRPSDLMLTAKGIVLHRVERSIASNRRQEKAASAAHDRVIAACATTPI